jgi:hypothetical protein
MVAWQVTLARRDGFDHIWFMTGRPCNPNSDLKRLWQLLLPGTPFPRCGTPAETGAASHAQAPLAQKQPDGAEPAAANRKA